MDKAKAGDRVKVHYTGSFEDGDIFDSSMNGQPLEFTIGEGKIISGFENGVIGMSIGEKKTLKLEPKDAYGEYNEDLSFQVDLEEFPVDEMPELGSELEFVGPEGESIIMSVVDIDDNKVSLDANHPLAGQELTFEIELVEII